MYCKIFLLWLFSIPLGDYVSGEDSSGVETETLQATETDRFLPYFYSAGGRQWGTVFLPDKETLHKPEDWSFTEGSVQRRPTLRESNQKRVYTSHIRGVSPTEAWRTEEKKALLFTHGDALPPTPRAHPQQGWAPCASLFTSGSFPGGMWNTLFASALRRLSWEECTR